MRLEVMAMFWVGDDPARAELAANAVVPLYADVYPDRKMITMRRKGGQLYLAYLMESDLDGTDPIL